MKDDFVENTARQLAKKDVKIIQLRCLAFALSCFLALSILEGCNKQIIDTTYKYDRAIIYLPDGIVVDGKVQSWTDFEDGDQIQVKVDGKTYLVHSSNVVLIDE